MKDNIESNLDFLEVNPQGTITKSIIWLHGFGAFKTQFMPIVGDLDLPASFGLRFVFPNAPLLSITMNNKQKMHAWFDIDDVSLTKNIDEVGIISAINYLKKIISNEESKGIDRKDIILAGFSQGAAVVLRYLLSSEKEIGGIILLSGYLPVSEKSKRNSTANLDTPIFLAHGKNDDFVSFTHGQQVLTELTGNKYSNITWHEYDSGHGLTIQEITDLRSWVQNLYPK